MDARPCQNCGEGLGRDARNLLVSTGTCVCPSCGQSNAKPRSVLRVLPFGLALVAGISAALTFAEVPAPLPADVRGELVGRVYTNARFGFRMKLQPNWEPVSQPEVERVAQRLPEPEVVKNILLTLARAPDGPASEGASLGLFAENLASDSKVPDGDAYLDLVLAQLKSHPQPPTQVRREEPVELGGLSFARCSLRRLWGAGDIGMTFWVAVTQGYALCFTGSYATKVGRDQIERALAGCTPIQTE